MRWILALLASACGAAAPPVHAQVPVAVPPDVDLGAIRLTREQIIATGRSRWATEEVDAAIPEAQRAAVLNTLLRSGELRCRRTDLEGCSASGTFAEPAEGETVRSPCYRRWLALTVLAAQGLDRRVEIDPALLDTVVQLDDELASSLASHLSEAQQLEVAHRFAVAKRRSPVLFVHLTPEGAARAVGTFHLDEAVVTLDREHHLALLKKVALDRTFSNEARTTALSALGGKVDAAWARRLVRDPSCAVAGAATAMVARTDRSVVPNPETRDPEVFMRALCIHAHAWGRDARLASSFAPGGIEVVYPDGEPLEASRAPVSKRLVAGKVVRRDGAASTWHVDEVAEEVTTIGMLECRGTTCNDHGSHIQVVLRPDAGGHLRLVRLIRPRDFGAEAVAVAAWRRCDAPF